MSLIIDLNKNLKLILEFTIGKLSQDSSPLKYRIPKDYVLDSFLKKSLFCHP